MFGINPNNLGASVQNRDIIWWPPHGLTLKIFRRTLDFSSLNSLNPCVLPILKSEKIIVQQAPLPLICLTCIVIFQTYSCLWFFLDLKDDASKQFWIKLPIYDNAKYLTIIYEYQHLLESKVSCNARYEKGFSPHTVLKAIQFNSNRKIGWYPNWIDHEMGSYTLSIQWLYCVKSFRNS